MLYQRRRLSCDRIDLVPVDVIDGIIEINPSFVVFSIVIMLLVLFHMCNNWLGVCLSRGIDAECRKGSCIASWDFLRHLSEGCVGTVAPNTQLENARCCLHLVSSRQETEQSCLHDSVQFIARVDRQMKHTHGALQPMMFLLK